MRDKLGGLLPSVISTVHIGDRNLRQFLFRDTLQAPDVDPVHLADWRIVADSEGTDTAVPAKEMLILSSIEQVLRQLSFTLHQPKAVRLSDRHPESIPTANRAVTSVAALREVEFGFESDSATVTAAGISFQQWLDPPGGE
jgi:hypothetical protein